MHIHIQHDKTNKRKKTHCNQKKHIIAQSNFMCHKKTNTKIKQTYNKYMYAKNKTNKNT